jgi:hypothetical protein
MTRLSSATAGLRRIKDQLRRMRATPGETPKADLALYGRQRETRRGFAEFAGAKKAGAALSLSTPPGWISPPSRESVGTLEERRQPKSAVHVPNMSCSLCLWNPSGSDEERRAACTPENRHGWSAYEACLGDANHRGAPTESGKEVAAQTRPAVGIKPYVAVNDHSVRLDRQLREELEQYGQLASEELAALIGSRFRKLANDLGNRGAIRPLNRENTGDRRFFSEIRRI